MATLRFWVIDPAHMTYVAKQLSGQRVEWCYLGTNGSTRARAERIFSADRHVSIAEELTRLAYAMKQPFLNWITEIGFRQRDPLTWWSSRLASKSPLQTDVFLFVCYAEMVQAWLNREPGASVRVVVIEDPWLSWVLRRQLGGDGRVRCLAGGWVGVLKDAMYWLARIPLSLVSTLRWALWSMVLGRFVLPNEGGRAWDKDRGAALIYSWVEERYFSVPGKFHDPYTGRLEAILSQHGECVKRVTPVRIPTRVLRGLKGLASSFLVTPRYLRLRDIASVLGRWLTITDLHRLSRFQRCDYAPLLYRELLREWGGSGFAFYHLSYRAMSRLARDCGRSVKLIIYPFENQPWEKLLCLAWRAHAPHVKLVGYQHSWVPALLLPYSLGAGEEQILPLPDLIVTNSEFNRHMLRAGGYPPEKLLMGGALRHEYFYAATNGAPHGFSPADGERTTTPRVVLVTLSISRPHSSSLFSDLLEAFQTPLRVGQPLGPPVEFIVKCHPQLTVSRSSRGERMMPPWITFSSAPMSELVSRADLLLYAGPTSSWWEAALSGVPVLKYQADGLDIDAGQGIDGMPVQVCSQETLRQSIEDCLQAGSPRARVDAAVVERMFGRVDEDLWLQITA